MKRKRREEMDFRELAAELARESIVTKCLARFLEQVIEEVHDTQIKPLREALKKIADGSQDPAMSAVANAALNETKRAS